MTAVVDTSTLATRLRTTPQRLDQLRRMLGLASPTAGFAEADADLLAQLLELVRRHGGDEETAALLARSFGHHMARLVTWQTLGLAGTEREDSTGRASQSAVDMMLTDAPAFEGLLVDVWRRHRDAVISWRNGRHGEQSHSLVLTVAFVDLVGYTRLTAGMDGLQVSALVREFERVCVEVVAAHEGRIVKTLGDEILFVSDPVGPAVSAGLDLAAMAHTPTCRRCVSGSRRGPSPRRSATSSAPP